MDGFGMILKSLGIDPSEVEAVKKGIPEFARMIDGKVTLLEAHMKAIDTKVDLILAHIEVQRPQSHPSELQEEIDAAMEFHNGNT